MATNTIRLRPCADISVEHTLYPEGSTSAYLLINENICDQESTYIESVLTADDGVNEKTLVSKFKLSSATLDKNVWFTDAKICSWENCANLLMDSSAATYEYSITIGDEILDSTGEQNFSLLTLGTTIYNLEKALKFINLYYYKNKTIPDLNLTVRTKCRIDETKTTSVSGKISQIYLELTYEEVSEKLNVLQNLITDGSFEDVSSNWTTWSTTPTDTTQARYGTQSLKLGGDSLARATIKKPIIGHKYYGREWIKTSGELTADDCRFEILSEDIAPEEAYIFGWNQGNYPNWTMISGIITIDRVRANSYQVRTFTVGGSVDAWVDGLMIIDLTEAFGEGKEPTKEWCDANIPYFEGLLGISEDEIISSMTPIENYINKLKGEDFRAAIKVEWLNPDESVNFEFTNALYDIDVNLTVNYQNGSRRSCTLTLNNDRNRFPVDFNNIWIGQKFKLWMGIYLDSETPYYFPQGVFYISNPSEAYDPSTRTVTINGIDKWAYLDGTLFGNLSGTYQTNIGDNLYGAIRRLLKLSRYQNDFGDNDNTDKSEMIDPISPLLSHYYINKKDSSGNDVLLCPYTATVERGKTFADILLEYATILCANVYYDVNGRLVLEPMIDTADDITDTNKEVLWHYTVDEKTLLGLTQTYNFDKIHNDFIVLGNIMNGYQFKGRVQNRNPMSNTCVQKIGLRTKEPIEDNQYVSDEQCVELAKYHAKTDTIMQKSGDISSITLYHLDVNKLVSISTPNNNMSKELFLITGFSLSASGTMTLNVTSVNILKNFTVVEAV